MTLLHYVDNEVPDYAEWTARVQNGSSTCVRGTAASFPSRGSYGLRVTIVSTDGAYIRKDFTHTIPPGGSLYVGIWMKFSAPGTDPLLWRIASGANQAMYVGVYGETKALYARIYNDAGGQEGAGQITTALTPGNWQYVVAKLTRAETDVSSDGSLDIYTNGDVTSIASGVDNYDRLASSDIKFYFGGMTSVSDGFVIDFDEIKIDDAEYPEPYVPTPSDEYLSADRTVVLARAGDSDSEDFADHCISTLGIPPANIIKLPDASGTETLVDFATWQSEVENFIGTYFTLNPTVASNCMCFLLGHGVPGYFSQGGVKYSGVSRLMRYGSSLSLGYSNPLYNPTTVARLTASDLSDESMYLATRIGFDVLQDSEDVVTYGAVHRSALSELADADTLFSSDATYRASLNCQHLRIVDAAMTTGTTLTNDAFCDLAWDTTAPTWGSGSNRCVFISTTAGSARTLRDDTDDYAKQLYAAFVDQLYAAGFGYSETVDGFDLDSFYEMLRLGGTLAEAFIVAIPSLNFTAVPLGEPLMTVAFQDDGYNLYRAEDSLANLGDTPVAYLRSDDTSFSRAGLSHSTSTRYVYVLRSVYNDLETPDYSCRVEMATDGDGEWTGKRPGMVEKLDVEVIDSGQVRIRWQYRTPRGGASLADGDFGIYYSTTPSITAGSPSTTEDYTADGEYSKDVTLTDGVTYWFAITARTTGSVESMLSPIIGPYVADDTAPTSPTVYSEMTF